MNLTGQNALKRDERCVRWKSIRLTSYLFNSWLRTLGFKVSGLKIQKFSLCFNKFFLVSLLKVLLRICSIIIKLTSLLKIWSFIAKWREAGIASSLYTSLRWLFSLKLFGSVLNLFQPYLDIACDTSCILKARWQNRFCNWFGGKL